MTAQVRTRPIWSTDFDAEVLQGTGDSIVTPAGTVPGHGQDPFDCTRTDGRSTSLSAVFGAVELPGDELTMPFQDGSRLHYGDGVRHEFAEEDGFLRQELALGVAQVRAALELTAEDTVLLNEVFDSQQE